MELKVGDLERVQIQRIMRTVFCVHKLRDFKRSFEITGGDFLLLAIALAALRPRMLSLHIHHKTKQVEFQPISTLIFQNLAVCQARISQLQAKVTTLRTWLRTRMLLATVVIEVLEAVVTPCRRGHLSSTMCFRLPRAIVMWISSDDLSLRDS